MDDPNKILDESGQEVKPTEKIGDFDDSFPALDPEDFKDHEDLIKASASAGDESARFAPSNPPPQNPQFVLHDLPDSEPASTTGIVQMIPVDKVAANPYQPRKFFDPIKLAELAESIKFQGIIQPLVLTKSSDGYEILVGERRFRAALLAGLSHVPAIVRGEISDSAKLELALIENLQREDLNPIEEARAYQRLSDEFHLTQEQIAKKVGKSRPAVANVLRLLNLPAQIQRAVIENKLTEGHARALLPLENNREKQMEVFEWMLAEGMTVRDVENRVREIKNLPLKPCVRSSKAKQPDPELRQIEDVLRERLGTKVRLQKTGDTGKIMIEFYSSEDLKNIIGRLSAQSAG